MSDNSSSTNSWTFLTSEVKESGVENVAASRSGSGPLQTEQLGPGLAQGPHPPDNHVDKTLNLEPPQVTHLDSGEDAAVLHAADLKADPVPSSDLPVESLSTLTSDPGEPGCSVDHGDHPAPDSELLSDTVAPTSPSPGSAPDPDTTPQDVEELSLKDERSELRRTLREEESKPNFQTSEEKVNDCAGVRRRNLSLLSPRHRRDEDEDDDVDEHIRHCPREDGFGFSLNKCIFGALVLLGLGTIFFSAGESDVGELKDPVQQKEWFNPDGHGDAHAAVQPSEMLQSLAKGSEQIAQLQAQLQQQEEQLKAAQVQVEEGFKERARREELEVENQQMKAELDRLPALQKQLEQETQRMKSESAEKDLQGLPAMQKALEFLRSQMAELSQNAASLVPSVEHEVAANQGGKGSEHKKQQGKELEEKRKNEWKKDGRGKKEVEKPRTERDGEKTDGKKWGDREKGKAHQEEDIKLRGKAERKDGKDEGGGKGNGNGKSRKDGGEKRRFSQDDGKGDERDNAKWKKEKRGELDSGRGELKEKKWKHGREWKKIEQAGGKEQKEGEKAWNEGKGQKGDKERGGDGQDNRKSKGKYDKAQKMGKGKNNNNHKRNGEKLWSGQGRDWLKHEGSAVWKEEMKSKDEHHQARQKYSGRDKPRHSSDKESHYSHSDRRYSKDHTHDDYWTKQRDRMRHYHGSTEGCADVTACAHAEGLVPVRQSDFETLLLSYLTRLLGPEEQMSKEDDLNKLVQEFFTDGLFIHDQMPFGEFVEDVADILEDLAENEGDEEMEDEMEGFVRDAMEKFAFPDRRKNEDKRKGVSG